jgi:hypothetical protein
MHRLRVRSGFCNKEEVTEKKKKEIKSVVHLFVKSRLIQFATKGVLIKIAHKSA